MALLAPEGADVSPAWPWLDEAGGLTDAPAGIGADGEAEHPADAKSRVRVGQANRWPSEKMILRIADKRYM